MSYLNEKLYICRHAIPCRGYRRFSSTAAWRYAGIHVKWSAGFQISICLADKSFSENPHNAKPQNVTSKRKGRHNNYRADF